MSNARQDFHIGRNYHGQQHSIRSLSSTARLTGLRPPTGLERAADWARYFARRIVAGWRA